MIFRLVVQVICLVTLLTRTAFSHHFTEFLIQRAHFLDESRPFYLSFHLIKTAGKGKEHLVTLFTGHEITFGIT